LFGTSTRSPSVSWRTGSCQARYCAHPSTKKRLYFAGETGLPGACSGSGGTLLVRSSLISVPKMRLILNSAFKPNRRSLRSSREKMSCGARRRRPRVTRACHRTRRTGGPPCIYLEACTLAKQRHAWRCFTAAIRAETNVAGSIGLAMWALKPAANDFARSS
jgi:hypothetical protein